MFFKLVAIAAKKNKPETGKEHNRDKKADEGASRG